MDKFTRHIKYLLLLAVALPMVSCMNGALNHYDDKVCDYSVQIRYDYNRENTSEVNLLTDYIGTLEEYIFDGDGILFAINPVIRDVCYGTWHSNLDLPPGRYSLITIGNRSSMSALTDSGKVPEIGITHRDDFLLTLQNEEKTRAGRGYYDNCGRLFHAYRTFRVEKAKTTLVWANMVHSHCVIRFTIRWKHTPPANVQDYYVQMKDLPSEYSLMPQFVYPDQSTPWAEYDCDAHDLYALHPLWVKHHIPMVHPDRNILTHRRSVKRVMNDIQGETVTYRLREGGQTMFSLHTAEGVQVMKDIPINDFLTQMDIDLDHTLRQEYEIIFEIDDVTGAVQVSFPQVGDWDEGSWVNY